MRTEALFYSRTLSIPNRLWKRGRIFWEKISELLRWGRIPDGAAVEVGDRRLE